MSRYCEIVCSAPIRVEVNGRAATAGQLQHPALVTTSTSPMQLLEPRLAGAGIPTRRGPVRLTDLPSVAAALVTSSLGVAPVGRIDGTALPVDPGLMRTVNEIYRSIPWEPI